MVEIGKILDGNGKKWRREFVKTNKALSEQNPGQTSATKEILTSEYHVENVRSEVVQMFDISFS